MTHSVSPAGDGAMVLSEADTDQFQTDGYVIVPDVFTGAECERIAGQIEHAAFELDLGAPEKGPLTYRPMMHLTDATLEADATDRRWAGIVQPLLPGEDIRLYWEQAVAKAPGARTELPWHQDNGYTPLIPEEYITCWLTLDDAEVANGCLWVIPGSHRHGTQPHHNDDDGTPFRVGHDGPDADGIPVPIAAGSVLVFSSLLMHRSGPNTSDRRRLAWILQYCGTKARSALSGKLLDDRLRCSRDGVWLDKPVRERDFDLAAVLANYDQGDAAPPVHGVVTP